MADQPTQSASRSRREVLAAASGAAAVLVTGSLWRPATASAADPNDVVLGAQNSTTSTTEIIQTAGGTGLSVTSNGTGPAINGYTPEGLAIDGQSNNGIGVRGQSTTIAGVWGESGDGTQRTLTAADTGLTGVFGFAPQGIAGESYGTGVWGDSPDGGVYGTGSTGVEGYGGWGVLGRAYGSGGVGVYAYAGSTTQYGLRVDGRVKFSRSGRNKISSGAASRSVSVSGVTSSSLVFAHLANSRSGRWIRAVVPTTGKFTVYLNTSVSSDTYFSWFILN